MVRRLPPALLRLALVLAGCGRLGFEFEEAAVSEYSDAGQSATGDGADGKAQDGGDSTLDGASGEGGESDASGGPADRDAGPGLRDASVSPEPDPGGDGVDASAGAVDAGPVGEPYPLPARIDCGAYAGTVSCDDFDGSRGGRAVLASDDGYPVDFAGGFATTFVMGPSARCAVQTTFAPVASGALYLRFSMYIPSGPPILGLNIGTFGQLATEGDFGLDLNLEDGQVSLYTSGDRARYNAPYVLPRDRWVCVLLGVENVDGASGSARVEFEGHEVLAATGIDTKPPSGLLGAAAGIDWTYGAQSATRLYVDNFLVTRAHPGACP